MNHLALTVLNILKRHTKRVTIMAPFYKTQSVVEEGEFNQITNEIEKAVNVEMPHKETTINEKEFFSLANNIDFVNACMDFEDNIPPLKTNPLQTLGDRQRLLKCLYNRGFIITKTK